MGVHNEEIVQTWGMARRQSSRDTQQGDGERVLRRYEYYDSQMKQRGPGGGGPVTVRVFGGMGVVGAGGTVSIGGPRQRKMLALLALRNGSASSVDWIAEYLWDDADRPTSTAPAIRTSMSRLRQSLPEGAQDWLRTESSGYVFDAPSSALEHLQFTALRQRATNARSSDDPLSALRLLDEALDLWRGDPFQELEDSDVARPTVEQLHLDRLEMMEERWEAALALGRHTQITGELAIFAGEHRLRDRATRQYALALYRSGRSPEGLRVVAAHREFLLNEAGLDPSPEMVKLEAAMLAGDGSLEVEKTGRPLRGYRLLEEIGSGAFSVVWRGIQPSVGREVAIKQIRSELASQPEFIRRFEAEARLIARIEHPHIVPLIDFWRDPDSAYLVMRLLRGDTLERRLDDGPLSIDETLVLAREIGGALSAAHTQNIIHRDVKTGNIMFDESGNAFLGDFGIALEASKSTGPAAAFSTGSPAYSAPEQIRHEPLGPPTDVFSLGVVLYECVTGTLPFADSGSVAELLERQLHTDFPPTTDSRPDVPPHISDAILQATQRSAADRFDSVAAFLDALGAPVVDHAMVDDPAIGVATNLPNPYLGLSAFDEADRGNFFGRESLVNSLLARFGGAGITSRCVGVVGPSGSGKSSVVRAGLSPALREGAVWESEQWFTSSMVPGSDPFEALEAALLRVAVNPPPSLLDQLRDGPRGILRCLRRCLGDDTSKIYLVIDQFEEIFTSADQQVASDFLSALAVAVEDPRSPLRLVFTLRADYYDRPLSHPSFARILDATTVNVTPLSADELERAMVAPAQRVGVGFEPGLVALIVADCIGQPAPLPLLQYAISELFDRRDGATLKIAAYEAMGGLSGALAGRAEAIHVEATDAQRSAIRRTFGSLTSPAEEAADLRRRVRVGDLGDDAETAWALKHFGTARLVTFDRDPSSREPTVEVAHEALLREWPRLAAWLDEDRDVLRAASAVAMAADAWDESGRPDTDLYRGGRLENAVGLTVGAPDRMRPIDVEFVEASQRSAEGRRESEQRRVRRLRQGIVGIAAALVIALVAGSLAFVQQRRANQQAERAEAQTALAAEQTRVAEAQTELAEQRVIDAEQSRLILQSTTVADDDGELAILLALEAHRKFPGPETEQAVLRAVTSSRTLTNPLSSFRFREVGFDNPSGCNGFLLIRPGGEAWMYMEGARLLSRDTLTGEVSDHGPTPGPCVSWTGDQSMNRRVAYSAEGEMWFGSYDGSWDAKQDYGGAISHVGSFNPTHRLLLVLDDEDGHTVLVVDDRTGQTISAPIGVPNLVHGAINFHRAAVSDDGAFVAVALDGQAGQADGVVIFDAETGTELSRSTEFVASDFAFDTMAGQLIVGTVDDSLLTLDLSSGEVLSSWSLAATAGLLEVGVRQDGRVVVASANRVEIFDRNGSTVEEFDIAERAFALLRPDGRLLTVDGANQLSQVYELALSAGGGGTIDLASASSTVFGEGIAAVIDRRSSRVESIDLATGERAEVVLNALEGDPFDPVFVIPDQGGFLAVSSDAQVGRWQDGLMIEHIDLSAESRANGVQANFRDGTLVVSAVVGEAGQSWLVDARPGHLGLLATAEGHVPGAPTVVSAEGGFHILNFPTVATHDRSGALQSTSHTRLLADGLSTVASAYHGDSVAFSAPGGAAVIDFGARTFQALPGEQDAQTGLGFVRDGAMLVGGSSDGTVRTWDIESEASPVVIWRGTDQVTIGPYDEETDSVWIAEPTRLLNLPLDPAVAVARACQIVSRDLTRAEWNLYVDNGAPVQSSCP